MKFKTKIVQTGNNTGIEISEEQLEELGGGSSSSSRRRRRKQ